MNIAICESIREEINRRFTPADFINEKGEYIFHFTGGWNEAADGTNFSIQGRKFTALATMFGIPSAKSKQRTLETGRLFLKEVFPGHPYLQPIFERLDEVKVIQQKLGEDRAAWIDFIKGEPVELLLLTGEKKQCRPARPLSSREQFRTITYQDLLRYEFAGKTFLALIPILLSAQEQKIVKKDKVVVNAINRLLIETGLFGPEPEEETSLLSQRQQEGRIAGFLGKDVERWRAYIRGEALEIDGCIVERPAPIPTLEQMMTASSRARRDHLSMAGKGSYATAQIFSEVEPRLKGESSVVDKNSTYFLLLQAIYGSSPALEKRLFEEERVSAAQQIMGNDPLKWREFLQGSPLTLVVRGE